jgi:hypothetical protein
VSNNDVTSVPQACDARSPVRDTARSRGLCRTHPDLTLARALIYATALINALKFVTVDGPLALEREANVRVPYQRALPTC